VPNHDALRAHEHLFHEQAQDSLSLLDRGCFGAVSEAPKKPLEVLRQRDVRLSIERFGLQCGELGAKRGLLLAKVGHASTQLSERHQLLLVRLHQSSLRSSTAAEFELQPGLLCRRGIRGSEITKTPVDLSANQPGICQELHHVAPYELFEVVLPDGAAGAHASVLIAVVVGAEASVVVQPSFARPRRRSVVAIATTRTRHEPLEKRRFFCTARREAPVILKPASSQLEDLL
jgi:hypothetical protein